MIAQDERFALDLTFMHAPSQAAMCRTNASFYNAYSHCPIYQKSILKEKKIWQNKGVCNSQLQKIVSVRF